jgi:subtilisin family serine protease
VISVSRRSRNFRRFRRAEWVAALCLLFGVPVLQAQQKRPVERADQLPVHSYAIPKPASALLGDEAALAALADSLRADLEADLAAYDIRDATALRSYYRALGTIAMLRRRLDDALLYESKAQPLEEKPAARMLSGMTLRPLIAAEKAPPGGVAQAFSAAYAAELARLPYDLVQAELKTNRARLEIFSPAFLEGQVAAEIDPAAKAGRISKDLAIQLVNIGFALRYVVPHRDEMIRQLSALIGAHRVDKADIWAARDVSLENRPELTPVVIAICDGGVDASLFSGRVWTNSKEVPANGKDDDGNGFVDDVHGIAWTWDGKEKVGDLRPLELSAPEAAQAKQNIKGFLDMQAALDSTEASALKRRLAGMSRDDVKPLLESVQFYAVHAHGTHVAGIATRGNPAARVLVVRVDFPYRFVGPAPTPEWAAGFARAMERSVAYYRKAGVRVVNMSWGISSRDLERDLEMNGVGANQEERHRLAMQYFETVKKTFGAAIAAVPEILFVSAAGNSNESNQFNEDIPPVYDFPNTITVGAVDKGGDEAAFTSFGKVDLYANGYEVESLLPGGDKLRWSGTSMASPQVVNLAAKLFAVHPRLNAAEVKKLIVAGADARDVSNGRSIRLLNEARSFELAGAAGSPAR